MTLAARRFAVVESPVGPLVLEATDAGLARVGFAAQGALPSPGAARDEAALAPFARALGEYFAGARRSFADVPLDDSVGTAFDRGVWRALATIPYGSVISYASLAARVGNPLAVRAVGRANGRNPCPVVVPCHRVVAADGSLGGYSGSLAVKSRLLSLEGAAVPHRSRKAPARGQLGGSKRMSSRQATLDADDRT